MRKTNFTSERIASFQCEGDKQQTIYWDRKTPGLGCRVTAGAKSYIFETRLHGKTLRLTIGDIRTWAIGKAQVEATRLKALTDQGIDPRKVIADRLAEETAARVAEEAAVIAEQKKAQREAVTVAEAWEQYIAERKPLWSALHLHDHVTVIQAGGIKRQRSTRLTEPGPLASLAQLRLVDVTADRIEAWAKAEAVRRPTRARLALRLFKAFLNWCALHPAYSEICQSNPARSKKARESLGKPKVKNDVLQCEQLATWFAGVQQIGNPVISAYLQCLLLTGARREELAKLRWEDVDFRWNSLRLNDKIEDFRMVPLTPYVAFLLSSLPRRSEWVFSSPTSSSGRLMEPSIAHRKACQIAGLEVSLHGLRRSFASLSEWVETPAGIAAQIQGHAPQGVREQNYIRRPLDLLRKWHVKIEEWLLEKAGIEFQSPQTSLRVVGSF